MPDVPTTLGRCTQAWTWLSDLTSACPTRVEAAVAGPSAAAGGADQTTEDGIDALMGMPTIPLAGGRRAPLRGRQHLLSPAPPAPALASPRRPIGRPDAAVTSRARLARGLRATPNASLRRPGLSLRTPDLSWLRRDLVAFDLETTGVNQHYDQAIEAGFVRITPQGQRSGPFVARLRPSCPISPGAYRAHRIRAADLVDERRFAEVAPWIRAQLADADLVGYNCRSFDCNLLRNEFARIGQIWPAAGPVLAEDGAPVASPVEPPRIIDVYRIFRHHVNEQAARRASRRGAPGKFKLQHQAYPYYCGAQLVGAHNAGHDAMAALDIFLAQLDAHDLPRDLERIDACYNTRGRPLRFARRDDGDAADCREVDGGHATARAVAPVPRPRVCLRKRPASAPAGIAMADPEVTAPPRRLAVARPRHEAALPEPATVASARPRRRLARIG